MLSYSTSSLPIFSNPQQPDKEINNDADAKFKKGAITASTIQTDHSSTETPPVSPPTLSPRLTSSRIRGIGARTRSSSSTGVNNLIAPETSKYVHHFSFIQENRMNIYVWYNFIAKIFKNANYLVYQRGIVIEAMLYQGFGGLVLDKTFFIFKKI